MLECRAYIGSRENDLWLSTISTVSAATRECKYTNQYEQSETSCGASSVQPHTRLPCDRPAERLHSQECCGRVWRRRESNPRKISIRGCRPIVDSGTATRHAE